VLASNTSYLNIDEMAKETKTFPQDVLGMHFFSPANVMKLCEIVRARPRPHRTHWWTAVAICAQDRESTGGGRGLPTALSVIACLAQRGKAGREAVVRRRVAAAGRCGSVHQVRHADGTVRDGADLAGLDIGWRSRKDRGIKSEIADALCEAGRFGQKTGKGYYKYEGRPRRAAAARIPTSRKLIDETLTRLRPQTPAPSATRRSSSA